ncbi:MAG: ATP-dependent DNA helicase RecG, partial [Lachnospiraceae bacterium]|nr:ATP-dependent DNA helicase RecG [Lachnospiraceae bacterium]
MDQDLTVSVKDLKGIGAKTAELFGACGVRSVEELLRYYPRTYDRMEAPVPAAAMREGERFAVSCTLLRAPALRHAGRYAILTGDASDGETLFHVTWFNQPYLKNSLYPGRPYIFRGYVKRKGSAFVMEQPAIYAPADYLAVSQELLPRYPLVKGLKNSTVIKAMREAVTRVNSLCDAVPSDYTGKRDLMPLAEAIREIHFPKDEESARLARRRLAYDEFFYFLLGTKLFKAGEKEEDAGVRMEETPAVGGLIKRLPYDLTGAQKRVLKEILADMTGGRRMHRLVQGDVGSGKTILALLAMLLTAENGYQTALMAPTQVLAAQHFETFRALMKEYGLNFTPVLLDGTLTAAKKRKVQEEISQGVYNCVIGTNALMQDAVEYRALGLVITDEQHRFGVRQRELLAKKGEQPHVLVMSATPIPRTLAMILYGDLEVSQLDELPADRKRIKNAVVGPADREKSWRFLAKEVQNGRQAYVICPLVEESDGEGMEQLENTVDYSEKLRAALPGEVRVGILHGRMKPEEKDTVMTRFAAHEIDVLVSTTVVEVGVNVPNATVMMIENAERFGLAQLHQ